MTKTFVHAYAEFPDGSHSREIWAWLDDESNDGADAFPYGGRACFLTAVYPENMELDIRTSDGQWSRENAGSNEITELVRFNRTNEASTSYPIAVINETVWLGRSLGSVTATGGTGIKTELEGTAELKITYTCNFTRYSILLKDNPPQNESDVWPVLVSIKGGRQGDDYRPEATLEMTFYGRGDDFADYFLHVVDDCTDEALADVSVLFDGEDIGATNAAGQIHVGRLLVGSRHTVKIEHPGYRLFLASTEIPEPAEDTAEVCG